MQPQIFDFFAKLFTPGKQLMTKNLTYEAIQRANNTIGFGEMVCFAKDFGLCPERLSKSELKMISTEKKNCK